MTTVEIEELGVEHGGLRRLFLLECTDPRVEAPALDEVLAAPFVALIAVDYVSSLVPELTAWMNRLIDAGCTHVHAWGSDSTKVDDLGDWTFLERFDYEVPEGELFLTSWHEADTHPIADTIFHGLRCGVVPEPGDAEKRDLLAITLGMPAAVVDEIRAAFAEPAEWVRRYCEDD